jgi:hypothetical protein
MIFAQECHEGNNGDPLDWSVIAKRISVSGKISTLTSKMRPNSGKRLDRAARHDRENVIHGVRYAQPLQSGSGVINANWI